MAFRVGQKVCFDPKTSPGSRKQGNLNWPAEVTADRVLTIRDIDHRYEQWYGVAGLRFEEVSYPPRRVLFHGMMEPAFPADLFRPVTERQTDISIFTAMLNPSKQTVEAVVRADAAAH